MKSAGAAMPSCGTANTNCALGEPMKLSHISFCPVAGLTAAVANGLIGPGVPFCSMRNTITGCLLALRDTLWMS